MKYKMRLIPIIIVTVVLMLSAIAIASSEKSDKLKDDIGRIDFVHHAKSGGAGKPGTPTCYSLMGVKWPTLPVNYIINPINPNGLSEEFVTNTLSTAAETWDASTSKELFSNSYSVDYSAQYGVQNYKNAVVFGDYPDSNAIAVTSIWYSKRTRQIVEFDMILNTRFNWGDASVNSTIMDLQNIATHEFGHGVGLNDIYTSSCSAVTMYGYSTEGDVAKRTLEQPDVLGLQKMYGA
jgi:hypothetical protein